MEYVYRYMAGIQEAEPGFKKVRFAPQLNNKLGYVTYSYDSVSGKYTSAWKINEDGTVTVRFEVPFGCSAVAVLPDVAEMKSFTELKDEKRENERSGTDGKENGSKENPQNLQEEIQLSAGIYEFCYRTNRDYRKAYTMNSRLEEMQNDPRAMEILARKLPLAVDLSLIHIYFSGGASMVLAAIGAGYVGQHTGSMWAAFATAIALGVVLSMGTAIVYIVGRLPIIICTIGMTLLYESLTYLLFGGQGIRGFYSTPALSQMGRMPLVLLPAVLAMILFVVYTLSLIHI